MYKEILRSIAGIGAFPIVSLLIFVAIFAVMLVRVLCMDREGVRHLAGLPLEDACRGASDAGAAKEGIQ